MTDCPNVAMRELLPELLHDALPSAERAHAERHLATCEACAAELALLRSARRAMVGVRVPSFDTAAIVAALPRPTGGASMGPRLHVSPAPNAQSGGVRRSPALWRLAAAVTFVSLGGMSIAIARSYFGTSPVAMADSVLTQEPSVQTAPPLALADTPVAQGAASRGLAVHPVLSELDDASLESLITELDQLEAAPLAEPEATPGSRMVASTTSGS